MTDNVLADESRQAMLARLVRMLSCEDLDEHETTRIVDTCLKADSAPAETLRTHYGNDAANVAQYNPEGVTAFIVFLELEDYFAVSDTVDELYEQVIDAFEQPQLPEYPYDDNDFETVSDFYRWVDAQLLQHHPRYQLISFGESYTNDFQVILVRREEAGQILALCARLNIEAALCNE